jgi:hypothetical protein
VVYEVLDINQVYFSVLDRKSLAVAGSGLDHVKAISDLSHEYHVVNDMIDSRIFRFDNKLFLVFNVLYKGGPPFFMAYCEVELTPQYTLRVLENTTVKMRHEKNIKRARQEKNWGPFSYTPNKSVKNSDNPPVLFFEYMVQPHRIIQAKREEGDGHKAVTKQLFHPDSREAKLNYTIFETTYCTQISSQTPENVWDLKRIHGGSAPLYLEKEQKYLSFFHMKGRFHSPHLTTYAFGAHLFSAEPPFAISHMSPEPIVADSFFQGKWAFKKADYIIFPMTFFIEDGATIVLSMAKNDRESWVIRMDLAGLLSSLAPVLTEPCDVQTDKTYSQYTLF